MCRAQVRRVVLAQALLMGLIGLVPGVGVGIGLACVINRSTNGLLGHQVAFRVDGLLTAGCCGLALAIEVLSALLPSTGAARTELIRASQRP
jgi:putative ABC transport system permease protein